jgi:hypothetical protein
VLTEAEAQASIEDAFHYEPDYQVLICRWHQQAIKGLKNHLEDAHGLKKKERQPYLEHYGAFLSIEVGFSSPYDFILFLLPLHYLLAMSIKWQ